MAKTSREAKARAETARGAFELTGVLLVDKPAGPTSHDVVARIRKIARMRRVGHTGTLDPFATGLLAVCLGRATRLARFLSRAEKAYRALVRFGFATDTYDRTGTPVSAELGLAPDAGAIAAALEEFLGQLEQKPPPFSAKKLGGERLHRLARRGVAVSMPPVSVEIYENRLLRVEGGRAEIALRVSSGAYVRSIAHELGERLGCGAHLEELRRTAIGSLRIEEAIPLAELEARAAAEGGERALRDAVLAPGDALRDLPALVAHADAVDRIRHGRDVVLGELSGDVAAAGRASELRLLDPEGGLVAVVAPNPEADGERLRPILVWSA